MADSIDKRLPRDTDTRDNKARAPTTFVPAGLLPEVHHDAGYSYRWVKVHSAGHTDTNNVSTRMREGWVPVKQEEQPHILMLEEAHARFPGMIEYGGLLLCKRSKEMTEAHRKYLADRTRAQAQGVDNDLMREQDHRMPVFRERRTTVSRSPI